MPIRDSAPVGSPCWADLWTSDIDRSRRFYGEVFGWESEEPNPEFSGYFSFLRDGVQIAGAMGDMGDMTANDTWKIYLSTDDIAETKILAGASGVEVISPAIPVGDLGTQFVFNDPTGAHLGAWQPGTFPGFTVLGEPGAPSWFELHTRDHAGAVAFYRSVFHWDFNVMGDTHDFRYFTMKDPDGGEDLAGIMDAAAFLPEDVPSHWSVYWEVDDSVARIKALGGSVEMDAQDTPYGRLATVRDPVGAEFKLRMAPA